MLDDEQYAPFVSAEGKVDTAELDANGLPWEWNDGDDGPAFAGPEGLPTVSVPIEPQEVP